MSAQLKEIGDYREWLSAAISDTLAGTAGIKYDCSSPTVLWLVPRQAGGRVTLVMIMRSLRTRFHTRGQL